MAHKPGDRTSCLRNLSKTTKKGGVLKASSGILSIMFKYYYYYYYYCYIYDYFYYYEYYYDTMLTTIGIITIITIPIIMTMAIFTTLSFPIQDLQRIPYFGF